MTSHPEPVPQPMLIGIDLGTTHSVVATSVDASADVEVFPIEQQVAAGQVQRRSLLPSALFAELGDAQLRDPLTPEGESEIWTVGEYARRRARELPGRAVVSAKSWLSHPGVDREAPILPWSRSAAEGEPPAAARLSPVEASARILRHIHRQLKARFAEQFSGARVVLTVPASFDQAARQLTLRAATDAGLDVQLVEEPQAAFYSAISKLGTQGLRYLLGARESLLVLVVDVGGGTTDLALVRVFPAEESIRLERVAVGRHLLLGGDNIDLALAHVAETRLGGGLSPLEFSELLLSVREAKESLLGADAPEVFPIGLGRAGASLVGATRRAELSRAEVSELVCQGFLPAIGELAAGNATRGGLVGFGLPYERDPAITRHVARFIARHQTELGAPDALLLNGGLFHSPLVVERLSSHLEQWLGRTLLRIENPDPDLSVARGAVLFAQSVLGRGFTIESRSAQGYYVGLAGEKDQAVCVIPRGAREGVAHQAEPVVGLTLGRATRFDLFASDTERHQAGDIVELTAERFQRLPRLTTHLGALGAGGPDTAQVVPVRLEGLLTAIGTLQLAAIEQDAGGARHRLDFELRGAATQIAARPDADLPPRALPEALERIARVYGKGRVDVGEREAKDLVRTLERLLGPRPSWELGTLRALADGLLLDPRARLRSADHERTFFWLGGYCLRPGFGYPGDSERVQRLGALFAEGLRYSEERRHWEAFLIAGRRVAAGLEERLQLELRGKFDPFIAPAEHKLKKPKNFKPQGEEDILWLTTWLERVPSERRRDLGHWLLERTWTSRNPLYWELIGRIGARVPIYASAHHVVDARVAERWLEQLLSENWQTLPSAASAAVSLARVTEDRTRDLALSARQEVARRLEKHGAPAAWCSAVLEYSPVAAAEQAQSYGDELPIGLSLIQT